MAVCGEYICVHTKPSSTRYTELWVPAILTVFPPKLETNEADDRAPLTNLDSSEKRDPV